MSTTAKRVLVVILTTVLVVGLWYATSVQGQSAPLPASEQVEARGSDWRITKWTHRIVSYRRGRTIQQAGRTTCNRAVAREHAVGGNWVVDEVISFYTRIDWCWGVKNGIGGRVWDVNVSVTPDHARFFWRYEGIVGSSSGVYPQYHPLRGPTPQPDCVFRERVMQYARGPFDGIEERTTPWIRWVVTGGGGCGIVKEVSGERVNDGC